MSVLHGAICLHVMVYNVALLLMLKFKPFEHIGPSSSTSFLHGAICLECGPDFDVQVKLLEQNGPSSLTSALHAAIHLGYGPVSAV